MLDTDLIVSVLSIIISIALLSGIYFIMVYEEYIESCKERKEKEDNKKE